MTDEPQVQEKIEGEQQEKGETEIEREAEKLERVAKEIKEANEKKQELLDKEEKLLSRREALNALGGDSRKEEPEPPKEETPQEYMKRVMSGGLNERGKEED